MSQFTNLVDAGPGLTSEIASEPRTIWLGDGKDANYLPRGKTISGAAARDTGNTGDLDTLRAGNVLGKIAASGKYGCSILGPSGTAYASGTTLNLAAATAVELVRRQGTTGTFKLTGPPTAAGTVRTLTVTYSAVNTETGNVTITALPVNAVQTVNFNIAATGGSVVLRVPKVDGTLITTTTAAWSATDATFLSNLNTVLDVATGVVGGIVAAAIPATDTDLGFTLTYSGTGYAGLPAPGMASVVTLPTSSTTSSVVATTAGVDGRFVAASLVQPTDGSEAPLALLVSEFGVRVTDSDRVSRDTNGALLAIGGTVNTDQIIHYPADASTAAWLKCRLNGNLENGIVSTTANTAGRFTFSDVY